MIDSQVACRSRSTPTRALRVAACEMLLSELDWAPVGGQRGLDRAACGVVVVTTGFADKAPQWADIVGGEVVVVKSATSGVLPTEAPVVLVMVQNADGKWAVRGMRADA